MLGRLFFLALQRKFSRGGWVCQRFLASQADDVLFPHVGRGASVVGDFQQGRLDVVAMVVRIVDVDDSDVEHGVGREASSVGFFAVVARVQVGLELLVDAVLVHADGTVRVRAADQRRVWVLRIEACAVGWEFLCRDSGLAAKMGKMGKGELLTESWPVILSYVCRQ